MNSKIIAKLSGSGNQFRLLFEGDNLPDIGLKKPENIDDALVFDPLEESNERELFYVELTEEQKEDMIEPYLEAVNFGLEAIAQPEYAHVNTIFRVSGRQLFISKVSAGSRIHEDGKKLIVFNNNSVECRNVSFAIDFKGETDAYYDGVSKVYFTNFTKAKSLFKGFSEFYQEAWYENKEEFLNSPLFAVSGIDPEMMSINDTKTIAEILGNPKLNLEDEQTLEQITGYVRNYPLSGVVLTSEGKIKLSTKEDVKCTLKLLTERYYTSELTGEVFEARGKKVMRNQKPENTYTQHTEEAYTA